MPYMMYTFFLLLIVFTALFVASSKCWCRLSLYIFPNPHHRAFAICHKNDRVGVCFQLPSVFCIPLMSRTIISCIFPSRLWSWCPCPFHFFHQNQGLHTWTSVQIQRSLGCLVFFCIDLVHVIPYSLTISNKRLLYAF